MKKIVILMLLLAGCSKKFEVQIDPRQTNSDDRVVSIQENLTYSNGGVVITDEVDPIFNFMYESKIAAPISIKNTYAALIQATSVSMISNTKMAIAYNTKTSVVEGGLDIVDITNLQAPVVLYSYVINNMEFADTKIVGDKLYLSGAKENQGSLLVTMDISNLSNPVILDTKLISSYYATSLSVKGNNLLVTTGDSGDVYSYLLDSAGIPQEISHEAYANLLFVQHYKDGYVILYDESNKTKLGYKNLLTNTFTSMNLRNVRFESPARFDIHGSIAYVSTADQQVIEQVDLLTMTVIHTISSTGRGNGLKYDNGLLYSASGEEGFKLFDVRDQFNPIYKGYFNFNDHQSANNIWTFNLPTKKVVVLADGLGGVKILSQTLSNVPANYCTYATSVVSYNPQGSIAANRKITSNVLGAPTGDIQGLINFTSLGKSGQIVVTFDVPVKNVSGPDLRIYEITHDGKNYSQYPEIAEVYGSNDGVTWTYLGLVKNDNGNPSLGQVDLGIMTQAKYIKVVDTTTSSISDDGFDIDGFMCLNQENAPVCDSSINQLKNGSFEELSSEAGLVNGVNLNNILTTGPGWDVFSQVPFWFAEEGSGIELQKNGVSKTPFEGNLLLELDSNNNSLRGNQTNTKVSQIVNLNPGNFKLKLNYQARVLTGNTSEMKVLVDDVVVGTINVLTTGWTAHEFTLNNLSMGSHKISLMGSGTQDNLGALVDDVSLKQICLP